MYFNNKSNSKLFPEFFRGPLIFGKKLPDLYAFFIIIHYYDFENIQVYFSSFSLKLLGEIRLVKYIKLCYLTQNQ